MLCSIDEPKLEQNPLHETKILNSSMMRGLSRLTMSGTRYCRVKQHLVSSYSSIRASGILANRTFSSSNSSSSSSSSSFSNKKEKVNFSVSSSESETGWINSLSFSGKGGETAVFNSANDGKLFPVSRVPWLQTTRTMTTDKDNDTSDISEEKQNSASTSASAKNRFSTITRKERKEKMLEDLMGEPLQQPAGPILGNGIVHDDDNDVDGTDLEDVKVKPASSDFFIPQIALHDEDGRRRKRVLILCTGGTLTMAPDPSQGGALAPVEGALMNYLKDMSELHHGEMPEIVAHEYSPFYDSSDLGPADWALLAKDIKANYLHFDGFVVLMGTDTMAYTATALSFMLENLGKPVIFTGSQIPLCEPYNDARRNLIMALIFASRDTISEVSIFFHDRLLRACRSTKVNTHRLLAFDSPNLDPLAKIGITIDENEYLALPPARGALRVHSRMDTRLLTIRLVPGFDDAVIRHLIEANSSHEKKKLKALVLQLYGTGNIPSVKESFIELLADAAAKDILVVASTQCFTGSVMMGHYATGQALEKAGVVSANDMTLEAISCKLAYMFGRGDMKQDEIAKLMGVSIRGEVTPVEALSPPPLSSAYQRASRKGKKYY